MEPLERLEQFAEVQGVKSGAVVADVATGGIIFGRSRAELDERAVLVGSELPGVSYQVLQDRADELGISPDPDQGLDSEADAPVRLLALQLPGDVVGLGTEVDGLEVHDGSRGAGKIQEVRDERRYLAAGGGDPLGVAPAVLAESVRARFQQQPAVTSQC